MPSLALALLASCYGVLFIVIVTQLVRIVLNRHRLLSFQFGFLLLVLLWTSTRVAYIAVLFLKPNMSSVTEDLLYWIPTNLEFTTFSYLALFYASVINGTLSKTDWIRRLRTRYITAFCTANGIIYLASLTWLVFTITADGLTAAQVLRGRLTFAAISAMSLVFVLAYFSARFSALLSDPDVILPFQRKSTSTTFVRYQVYLLALVFASRAVYDILSAANLVTISIDVQNSTSSTIVSVVFLFVWEVVPIATVLFFFRDIPRAASHSDRLPAFQPYTAMLRAPILVPGGGGGSGHGSAHGSDSGGRGSLRSPVSPGSRSQSIRSSLPKTPERFAGGMAAGAAGSPPAGAAARMALNSGDDLSPSAPLGTGYESDPDRPGGGNAGFGQLAAFNAKLRNPEATPSAYYYGAGTAAYFYGAGSFTPDSAAPGAVNPRY